MAAWPLHQLQHSWEDDIDIIVQLLGIALGYCAETEQ